MKILVVAAMQNELKAIKQGIKSAGLKVNLNIDYLCCGIGNYEAISSLEHYFTKNSEPTFIWNIGICGYWNQNNEIKSNPIQIASIINIHTEKEIINPPFLQIATFKTCFSSENVIVNKPEFKKNIGLIDDEMYFDMESRGVGFIATKYKYPYLLLKIPFDFVGKIENVNKENYKKYYQEISIILNSLPYYDYLKKILNWIKNNELNVL